MSVTWAIKDWHEVFEDYRSREVARLQFLHCRVLDRKSEAYAILVAQDGGVEAYGVFWALVLIAARCPARGVLADDKGTLTISRLAARARMSVAVVEHAVAMLSHPQVGWLVVHSTDGAPTAHRPNTDGSRENTDERRKTTDEPPTKPGVRTERARDTTQQNTTTTATGRAAAAAAAVLSSEEVEARKAYLRKRPDWLPDGKPWIDASVVAELASMPRLDQATVESVYRVARDGRLTMKNPAGLIVKRLRAAGGAK